MDAQLKDQLDLYTKTKEMEAARSGDLHQLCMDFERDLECHRQTFIEMLTNNETAKLQANSNANIEQTRLQCQKDIAAEKQAALERVIAPMVSGAAHPFFVEKGPSLHLLQPAPPLFHGWLFQRKRSPMGEAPFLVAT